MPAFSRALALVGGIFLLVLPSVAKDVPNPAVIPPPGQAKAASGPQGDEFPADQHVLISTFFYWYRYVTNGDGTPNMVYSDHIFQQDPVIGRWTQALSDLFPEYWNDDPTKPYLAIVDWANPEWYKLEFRDMAAAHIDIATLGLEAALPLCLYDTPTVNFSGYRGVHAAAQAAREMQADGEPCPKLGCYWDTGSIAGFDLTTGFTEAEYSEICSWPYTHSENAWAAWLQIRQFFRALGDTNADRAKIWGTVDGRPLIVAYGKYRAKATQQFWSWLSDQFLAEFGVRPYITLDWTWMEGDDGNPIRMDAVTRWNNAITGPADMSAIYGGARMVGIGPGYDSTVQETRFGDFIRPREDGYRGHKNPTGNFYDYSWQQALAMHPKIIHIETWNERHEGTGICRTPLWGDAYIRQTAHYADIFHAGGTVPQTTVLENTYPIRKRMTEGMEFKGRKILRYTAALDTMNTNEPIFFRQRSASTADDGGLTIMRIPYGEDEVRYQAPYLVMDPRRVWTYVKVQVPDPWGFDLPDNQLLKLRMTYIDDRSILPTDPQGTLGDLFVNYDSWIPTPNPGETPPNGAWPGGNANSFAWAPDAQHLNSITDLETGQVQTTSSVLFPLTGDPSAPHRKTVQWYLWRPRFGNRQNIGSDISISVRVPDRTKSDPLKIISVELEAEDPSRYGDYDFPFVIETARIAAGLDLPPESEQIRHNVYMGGDSADIVDLEDVATVARKVAGMAPNP